MLFGFMYLYGGEIMIRTVAIILILSVFSAAISCGNEKNTETSGFSGPAGQLSTGYTVLEFSGTTGSTSNMLNPITWNDIPMPGILEVQIYGTDVQFDNRGYKTGSGRPVIKFTLPCGPDGDFFVDRTVIPSTFSIHVDGVDIFPPVPFSTFARVRLLDNPADTLDVDFEFSFAFSKGETEYQGEVVGMISVPGGQVRGGVLESYPPLEMPDSLTFHVFGEVYQPGYLRIVEEQMEYLHQFVIFAFMEPCRVSDPRKAEQTYFSFSIPGDMLDGNPVPAGVTAYICQDEDTLTYTSSYAFGYITMEHLNADSMIGDFVKGEILFQNNGSQNNVGFFGGGPFEISLKNI